MTSNDRNTTDASTEVVALIAQHQSRLRGFVRCLLVHDKDVDDLLQEVNVVLWQKADQFEIGTDFWAWASQVARFKVMNQVRKYSRDRLVFDESFMTELADLATERSSGFEDQQSALRHCMKQLPGPQRALIEMRYSSERSIGSIADELGRPEGSIRQTLYRIRGLLLQCIELHMPETSR
ncbi:sigma-70 family RNA polymerase sigma factor [Novipirellula rosea]|uniref:RNA polymerase sigma factor n=1 Tax=Novipirellula rosea TaxID=1031540 RepID=A0ABP8MAU0_9BACT